MSDETGRAARLEYGSPATTWLECLPLGDGSLGAMCDGVPGRARIRLTHETAWSGSPASEGQAGLVDGATASARLDASRVAVAAGDPGRAAEEIAALQAPYTQAFLPLATLVVHTRDPAAPVDDGEARRPVRRCLDLLTAEHVSQYDGVRETTLVARGAGVLVHRVEVGEIVALDVETPWRVLGRRSDGAETTLLLRLPSDVAPTHEPDLPAARWDPAPGRSIEAAVVVRRVPVDGGEMLVGAVETTFAAPGLAPEGDAEAAARAARRRIDEALRRGPDEVVSEHRRRHGELMSRCRLELAGQLPPDGTPAERVARAAAHPAGPIAADPGLLELLFDYGRYLLIASAAGSRLPPTLQGIWNDDPRPPWSSNYTLNINTPMNHWAALCTGLPECLEPLFDLVRDLGRVGGPTARTLYGARGWVVHHNTDAWLFTHPVGRGSAAVPWSAWPLGGAWLVRHIGDALEHGVLDDDRLQTLWHAVRGAAAFALDWLREDADGWTTAPATSPENLYRLPEGSVAAVDRITTMDLELLRGALAVCVAVAARMDPACAVAAEARDRLRRLAAQPPLSPDGALLEWAEPRTPDDPHHRHISPLIGLSPGGAGAPPWSDEARAAAAALLEERGDDSTGWSLVWKAAAWARLGRGDRVEDLLGLLVRPADDQRGAAAGLYSNLFAAHPPFQIDANLALPAVLADAVARAENGRVLLLPALLPSLSTGRASGLRVPPGLCVDLEWRDGAVQSCALAAEHPGAAGPRVIVLGDWEISIEVPASGIPVHWSRPPGPHPLSVERSSGAPS